MPSPSEPIRPLKRAHAATANGSASPKPGGFAAGSAGLRRSGAGVPVPFRVTPGLGGFGDGHRRRGALLSDVPEQGVFGYGRPSFCPELRHGVAMLPERDGGTREVAVTPALQGGRPVRHFLHRAFEVRNADSAKHTSRLGAVVSL